MQRQFLPAVSPALLRRKEAVIDFIGKSLTLTQPAVRGK
jgi:hypothetical protein